MVGAGVFGALCLNLGLWSSSACAPCSSILQMPLLPLVGQELAGAFPKEATAMISACIVAAQLVMLPIDLLVGRTADTWGRKPLFLVGFAILAIRAALYTFYR
jgi:MFS family permease